MRRSIVVFSLLATSVLSAQADPHMAKAMRVLKATPLVDGHNDLPWYIRMDAKPPRDVEQYDLRKRTSGNTDIARLRAGRVGGQFWSVYIPGDIKDSGYAKVQLEQIDIAQQVIARYPDVFEQVTTAAGVRSAFRRGKIGSMLGMEGGHAIENSLGALRAYYRMGVRYMTLTHNVTLDWADAANDKYTHGGLTKFGEEVVREMNRLGMLVDLSHVSPGVMSDALDVAEAPVIFSHSGTRELVDVPRNVPDSILRRLPKNGGVVMVPFVPGFVSPKIAAHNVARRTAMADAKRATNDDSAKVVRMMQDWDKSHPVPHATVADVADQIDHVRKVAGIDHVGIGSDYDGTDNDLPDGLEDVSKFPVLLAELSRRGWSEMDLRKLAGENVLRAMTAAERTAARLQKLRPPSTKTIEQLDGKM